MNIMISLLNKKFPRSTRNLLLLLSAFCLASTILASSDSPIMRLPEHSAELLRLGTEDTSLQNDNREDSQENDSFMLSTTTTAQADPICNDVNSHRYDPLTCWLWKLKVDVPDQEVKKSPFKVVRSFSVSWLDGGNIDQCCCCWLILYLPSVCLLFLCPINVDRTSAI